MILAVSILSLQANSQTITLGTGSGSIAYDGTGVALTQINIKAGTYSGGITLSNVNGTPGHPVLIINSGGQVITTNGSDAGLDLSTCRYLHLTGTGTAGVQYGFLSTGGGTASFDAHYGTSDCEIDHIECAGSLYAGLVFRTYPSTGCQWSISGGNTIPTAAQNANPVWKITGMIIHDNYVHDVPGEGMYLGQSHYGNVAANAYDPTPTGNPLGGCSSSNESPVIGAHVYNNIVKNVGYDGIQASGCLGCTINNNTIIGFATQNQDGQDGGITWNPGSYGIITRNWIQYIGNGFCMGIMYQGQGDSYISNNIIIGGGSGQVGLAMLRNTQPNVAGSTHKNIYLDNNTIVGFQTGYWWYGDNGFNSTAFLRNNNVIAPSVWTIGNGNISTLQKTTNIENTSNTFPQFVNYAGNDLHLTATSPAVSQGTDVTATDTTTKYDYAGLVRAAPFDIGSFKFGAGASVPIILSNFSGTKDANNRLKFTWTTQMESNSDSFFVERSSDQKTWVPIISVKTKTLNGNSSVVLNYGPYYYNLSTGVVTTAAITFILVFLALIIAMDKRNRMKFMIGGIITSVIILSSTIGCTKDVTTLDPTTQTDRHKTTKFYRLKEKDKDGKLTYSQIIPLN